MEINSKLNNVSGGGLHYITNYQSDQTRIWYAGLKQTQQDILRLQKYSFNHFDKTQDKLDYQRVSLIKQGYIISARAQSTQMFNFHYLYGGVKKYIFQRYFYQYHYKKFLRFFWLPWMIVFTRIIQQQVGSYGMRKYDNAAYDYYYFVD